VQIAQIVFANVKRESEFIEFVVRIEKKTIRLKIVVMSV